jgi:hypothetical protein
VGNSWKIRILEYEVSSPSGAHRPGRGEVYRRATPGRKSTGRAAPGEKSTGRATRCNALGKSVLYRVRGGEGRGGAGRGAGEYSTATYRSVAWRTVPRIPRSRPAPPINAYSYCLLYACALYSSTVRTVNSTYQVLYFLPDTAPDGTV